LSKSLRSPLDRAAPFIFLAVGSVIAAGVVVVNRYRDNEVAVWSILGIASLAAAVYWLLTTFSPIIHRRVCKRCGATASADRPRCVKCSAEINWRTVRAIPNVPESPIPCLRGAAAGWNPWFVIVPGSLMLFVLLIWTPLIFVALAATVFLSLPFAGFVNRRKILKLVERLEAADGRLCSVCMYARDDGGDRCPECGLWEAEGDLQAQWERSGLWARRIEVSGSAEAAREVRVPEAAR
jgi:RNA polymerase subunit RPABC4/transcription elongation factor Spt4